MPAWTTPADQSTGTVITSTLWNQLLGTNGDVAYLYGDTGWTNMTGFTNGWSSVASPFVARYRLAGNFVTIQGVVTGGTVTTAFFTLPSGYRPGNTLAFATTNGATTFAAIQITNGGVMSQTAGTNTNLHIECIFSVL